MKENKPHIDKLQARLRVLKSDLENLQAKAAEANADARIRMQDTISNLQVKRRELADQIEALKSGAAEASEEMVKGLQASWNELEEACTAASGKMHV